VISPARALLDLPPFGLGQAEKRARLLPMMRELTRHHGERCVPYRNVLDRVFGGADRLRKDHHARASNEHRAHCVRSFLCLCFFSLRFVSMRPVPFKFSAKISF